MTSRPRLLDLFCGEGGAGAGYQRAGFDVFGVDVSREPLRRYPYPHAHGDALDYLTRHGAGFDVIHASPPCKVHNAMSRTFGADDLDGMLFPQPTHIDLVAATRAALDAVGRPYIIENVPGAPLVNPVTLCGTMFDLGAQCEDGWRVLRRHRRFESSLPLVVPMACNHSDDTVGVYGHGRRRWVRNGGPNGYGGDLREARDAMGMPWASTRGVSQAIPPAYTEWLGRQLLAHPMLRRAA